jgi:hypothetical protein
MAGTSPAIFLFSILTMELVNKVAQSGIITLDLEKFLPQQEIVDLDISQFLFRGLLLKEMDFRSAIKTFDWSAYNGKIAAVHCSTDAIVAQWAYMLISSALQDAGALCAFGKKDDVMANMLINTIRSTDVTPFTDQRVVVKGCGGIPLPDAAFLEITTRLKPVVKSLMFGEPCSTVPVFKKKG